MGLEHENGVVPPSSIWKKANYGENIIIGNLDTGEPFSFFQLLLLLLIF